MSIISSLFFILLCLSSKLGSSEARYIELGRGHKGLSAPLLHFGKGQFLFVDTFKPAVHSSTKEPVVQVKQEDAIAADDEPPKTSAKGTKDYSSRSSSSTKADVKVVAAVKPHVSISWSAARQINHRDKTINHGDKTSSSNNPGFYSDYSRPRTRPPSHN